MFINSKWISYGLCFLYLLFNKIFGIDDNQFWTSIKFEKQLPYSLELECEQELRLKNQLSTFNQTFSEVSITYKINDRLNIHIPYRYAIFDEKIKKRISFGGTYKFNLNPISVKYRSRFQRTKEQEKDIENLIRNKLTFQYMLDKKIEPFLSGELMHFPKAENQTLDGYRFSLGFTFNLPRKNSIKIFYIFKKGDFSSSGSEEINIYGLTYSLKLS